MKRLITLLLAMVMALSLVVPAWAGEETLSGAGSTASQNVTVEIQGYTEEYSVKVSWESLNFVYQRGDWSASDHNYSDANWKTVDGRSNATSAVVTVENHSNANIWYTAELADNEDIEGVTVGLSENFLARILVDKHPVKGNKVAVNTPTSTFNVNVSGVPEVHEPSTKTVRSLTVTIYTSAS